jgi:hypothetical protein
MVTRVGNSGNNRHVGTTYNPPFVVDDRDKLYGLEGNDTLIGGGGLSQLPPAHDGCLRNHPARWLTKR